MQTQGSSNTKVTAGPIDKSGRVLFSYTYRIQSSRALEALLSPSELVGDAGARLPTVVATSGNSITTWGEWVSLSRAQDFVFKGEFAATATSYAADIQSLERLYTFGEDTVVIQFLERYPFLIPLLLEARDKVQEYFPGSPTVLETVSDPEASGDDQLVLFIVTDSDPEQVLDSLDRLDENWWLDALDRAQGKLGISVEFV